MKTRKVIALIKGVLHVVIGALALMSGVEIPKWFAIWLCFLVGVGSLAELIEG